MTPMHQLSCQHRARYRGSAREELFGMQPIEDADHQSDIVEVATATDQNSHLPCPWIRNISINARDVGQSRPSWWNPRRLKEEMPTLAVAMRHITKIAALAFLPFVLGGHARASDKEGNVMTLSCVGTLTRTYGANKPMDPEPLQNTGMVVNLNGQTVFFLGYVVPIEKVDEASINFGARQTVDYGFSIGIRGHIDRASGRMGHNDSDVRSDDGRRP